MFITGNDDATRSECPPHVYTGNENPPIVPMTFEW